MTGDTHNTENEKKKMARSLKNLLLSFTGFGGLEEAADCSDLEEGAARCWENAAKPAA